MSHHPNTDAEAVLRLRTILSRPEFLGRDAWQADEAYVLRFTEAMMNTYLGSTAKLRLAGWALADAIRSALHLRSKRRRLGPWEHLMREAC